MPKRSTCRHGRESKGLNNAQRRWAKGFTLGLLFGASFAFWEGCEGYAFAAASAFCSAFDFFVAAGFSTWEDRSAFDFLFGLGVSSCASPFLLIRATTHDTHGEGVQCRHTPSLHVHLCSIYVHSVQLTRIGFNGTCHTWCTCGLLCLIGW